MSAQRIQWICVVIACLSFLFSSGCVETAKMYHGNKVPVIDAIPVQAKGPHNDLWKTPDLAIDYTYSQNGDVFDVAGDVALGDHPRNIYPLLKNLSVYLFFLDADSQVLETVSLVNILNKTSDIAMTFDRTLKKPAGTAGIFFGYSGFACEPGKSRPFHNEPCLSFNRLPLRK